MAPPPNLCLNDCLHKFPTIFSFTHNSVSMDVYGAFFKLFILQNCFVWSGCGFGPVFRQGAPQSGRSWVRDHQHRQILIQLHIVSPWRPGYTDCYKELLETTRKLGWKRIDSYIDPKLAHKKMICFHFAAHVLQKNNIMIHLSCGISIWIWIS